MKLTGNLKTQVEKAETREVVRETIANAGMLLNDAELDQVSGGLGSTIDDLTKRVTMVCETCDNSEFTVTERAYASGWRNGIACPFCFGMKTHKKE